MQAARFRKTMKNSLMARLVGAFFVFLVLTVSLVGFLVYYQATRSLTQSVFDRLHAVSTLKEDSLDRWVDQQRLDLVFISWQPEMQRQVSLFFNAGTSELERGAAYDAILDYLKFVVTSVSDSDELFIMDLEGRVVLSTQPANERQSQAQSLFFQRGRSTTYVQPVYTSANTNRPTITVATPLFDQNKRRVGVLAGHLNLARIDRVILERTGLGTSGETYLVNPDHEFVSAVLFSSANQPDGMKAESRGIDAALSGNEGADLYTNYQGIPVIGVYTWLDDREVALMAEMSQAEAFAPARQLAVTIIQFGLISAVVLSGMGYLMARQIARPILGITRAAEQVAAGDFTQQAPVITDDEVGLLATTFNAMTEQLRLLYESLEKKVAERTADLNAANQSLENEIVERSKAQEQQRQQNVYLNALHETTLGIVSRLNLEDLLETLVTRAGQLLNTEHGLIYILEPGADEIECRVGVGVLQQLVGLRLKKGEGLGGTVWLTGAPEIVDDYKQWSSRVRNVNQDLIRNIVGIPIKSGEQLTGVIGLAYACDADESLTFGEDEIALLSRFAQLASVALDNARLFTAANEARAAAEAANESKSEFLANVSHELRTPLTSILGFARIVQKRLTERIFPLIGQEDRRVQRAVEQVDENLKIVLAEGDRLTTLINDLLDLEKIRAGKMAWNMQPLNPAEIIAQAGSATAALFEEKNLTWVTQVPANLPQVMGDRDRLVQVCINLISNAVKFTSAGTITCAAEVVEMASQRQEIVIRVIDQGIGIARDDQALVFEKFKQVGDTLTGKPKGTGLGLPISKEIIENHGGRIWLESEPGQGSTFFFSLPLQARLPAAQRLPLQDRLPLAASVREQTGPSETALPAPQAPIQTDTHPIAAQEDGLQLAILCQLLEALKPRLRALPSGQANAQKTILVVDDDPNIRKLLREEFEAEQYEVREAANGREALEQVKQGKPDLLVLDVMMPEMNGLEVASILKGDPETNGLPIVIVSIVQSQEQGYQLNVDGYFSKPIDIPALLAEVEGLLAEKPARRKVLVIDEDPGTLRWLSEALRANGYQVSTAAAAAAGMEKALAIQPDLIIASSRIAEEHRLVQVIRFEKGLENIVFLLFS